MKQQDLKQGTISIPKNASDWRRRGCNYGTQGGDILPVKVWLILVKALESMYKDTIYTKHWVIKVFCGWAGERVIITREDMFI